MLSIHSRIASGLKLYVRKASFCTATGPTDVHRPIGPLAWRHCFLVLSHSRAAFKAGIVGDSGDELTLIWCCFNVGLVLK